MVYKNLSPFTEFGQHYNVSDVLFPNHAPKVSFCTFQRSLGGNELLFTVVALDIWGGGWVGLGGAVSGVVIDGGWGGGWVGLGGGDEWGCDWWRMGWSGRGVGLREIADADDKEKKD